MIQGSNVNEVVADQGRDDDAADQGTEIGGGTETGEADHGREWTAQKTAEETEVDLEKEEGSYHNYQL